MRNGQTAIPDRLGRSLKELLETIEDLKQRGIHLVSLEEKIDTASAAGELVFHVFGAIAHFERRLIAERTRDGIAAAMKTQCTGEQLEFHALGRRLVTGRFDGGRISTDAGGFLLREVDKRTGVTVRVLRGVGVETLQDVQAWRLAQPPGRPERPPSWHWSFAARIGPIPRVTKWNGVQRSIGESYMGFRGG